jgi:hypothetical protein
MIKFLAHRTVLDPKIPITCCECGKQPHRSDGRPEYGELFAREMGWQGFSYLRDINHRLVERIGCCPECHAERRPLPADPADRK